MNPSFRSPPTRLGRRRAGLPRGRSCRGLRRRRTRRTFPKWRGVKGANFVLVRHRHCDSLKIMKHSMFILVAVQLLFFSVSAFSGEKKTLLSNDAATESLTLGGGESATLVYAYNTNPSSISTAWPVQFDITKGTKAFRLPAWGPQPTGGTNDYPVAPVTIAGPATIRLIENGSSADKPFIATFDFTRVGTASNPVGIPIEAGSTFQVILESSSDLVNWTPANPGDYSGTEVKRFFRTRIVKK